MRHLASSGFVGSFVIGIACALNACATAPDDGVGANGSPARSEDETKSQPLPPAQSDPSTAPVGGGGDTADAASEAAGDASLDAPADTGAGGPQTVTIRLVSTRTDWVVAGQPAPFKVQLDAKNCNLFGNDCDANVSLTLTIDAPASSPSSAATCSQTQSGTGVRQCSQGSAVTKTATLTPGADVKVRFHAEAIDDPGANPRCDIDKTWTFTGAGFTLKGEASPATGYWQCIGGGSGQNLDVLLGYKLSL